MGPGLRLRAQLAAGLGYKAAGQVALQALRVGVTVVLARLLTPGDVGLAAVAIAITALGAPFADLALGPALIQRAEITETESSTVFWANVAAGVALTAIGLLIAVVLALVAGSPQTGELLGVLSAAFLVQALGTTHGALLVRAMRFGALEAAALAGATAAAATAIALAAGGAGPWALVGGPLAGAALQVTALWLLSGWRPARVVDRAALRSFGGFGVRLLGVRSLFTLHRNADNLLVGGVLGTTALGVYGMAYNLAVLPFNRVVDPLRDVLFPALSRVKDDDPSRVAGAWLRATQVVTTLLAPAFAVLVVCGDDAVSVVLGDRWAAAAAPLRVLAAVGILQTAISFCSVVLPVLDRTAELLRFAVLPATLSIAGFAAGLPWGTTGVAVGYLAANVVLVPLYLRLTARVLDVGGRAVATALAGPAALTGMVGTAALAGRLAAGAGDAPPAAALAAGAGLGLLAWALGVRALTPVLLAEGRRLWAARSAPVAA